MFWVYILRCNDKSYYCGHTDNLEHRLHQHHNRAIPLCYTATRLPVELVYTAQFPSRIKGWSRKKKDALIKGNWEEISLCAKRKRKKSTPATDIPFETAR